MCVFLKENLCSQKTCEQGFNKHKALWKEWGGVWGGEGKVWGSPFLQKSFPSPQYFSSVYSSRPYLLIFRYSVGRLTPRAKAV